MCNSLSDLVRYRVGIEQKTSLDPRPIQEIACLGFSMRFELFGCHPDAGSSSTIECCQQLSGALNVGYFTGLFFIWGCLPGVEP